VRARNGLDVIGVAVVAAAIHHRFDPYHLRPNGLRRLPVIRHLRRSLAGYASPGASDTPLDDTRASLPSGSVALERALTPLTQRSSVNAPRRYERFRRQRGVQESYEPHRPLGLGGNNILRQPDACRYAATRPCSLLRSPRHQDDR
jgi:hypothetical protein